MNELINIIMSWTISPSRDWFGHVMDETKMFKIVTPYGRVDENKI